MKKTLLLVAVTVATTFASGCCCKSLCGFKRNPCATCTPATTCDPCATGGMMMSPAVVPGSTTYTVPPAG
jgi:hypothetical protein